MTGDFTSVPLRAGDAWTGARLQQGRVLLDGDWNLSLDASTRDRQRLAAEAIGPAGVLAGSTGFQAGFAADGTLQIGAGSMWVGGLQAVNPALLAYSDQEAIAPLPASGTALVYLDAFVQEVQAAENPADLLDPALDGVDTTTRTRVAWRVRAVPADATSCAGAASALPAGPVGTGLLDVSRTTVPAPADPCAPPDDPRARLPDGLLRIEVLDSGTEATARFGWSYENGSAAVAATVAGEKVTLSPSPAITFYPGDLVEVSTLQRRADRLDCGPLAAIASVDPGAGGSVVTLPGPAAVAGTPAGLCLRRWDGQVTGAAAAVAATLGGTDVGVAFTARPGSYLAGDWWAASVRGSSADAVGELTAAPPDGTPHYTASLAVVDLGARTVLTDCRPPFAPLTGIKAGTCTVTALPGDDLQAAADSLPASGGELCLAAGTYLLDAPVTLSGKSRIVVTGIGPATVLRAPAHESVLQFQGCTGVTVRDLRAESGTAGGAPGEPHLLGVLSFLGCTDVTVRDCELACPDSTGRAQSGLYAAPAGASACSQVRVLRNKITVGDQQAGVLVLSCDETYVERNEIRLGPAPAQAAGRPLPIVAGELATFVAGHVVPPAEQAGKPVTLPGGASLRIQGATQVQRIAQQFGKTVTVKALAGSTPARQLRQFTRRALLAPESLSLSRANTRFLLGAATSSRAVAQGIVIGGARAGLVRIEGNLISGSIEGIHVGLGGSGGDKIDAGEVILSGNVVAATIPFFWTRSRHAFYVGSYQRLTMTANAASLVRIGGGQTVLGSITATPVEAARIHGRSGPWLAIRGLELTGPFAAGVAITDLGPVGKAQLHYVSDVLNSGATGPALTPATVPHDRCVP